MSTKGDYVAHRVKVSVVKVCRQVLFLSNPIGYSGGKKVRYWFIKHRLAEVDVSDRKYGRQHWVGRLREGREAQDSDCGAGIAAVGLGIGEQLESYFIVLSYRNGKEGGDKKRTGWGLVQRPCDGRVWVLEVGECIEEDLLLCLLEVQVWGGGCRFKERGVPHNIDGVACS